MRKDLAIPENQLRDLAAIPEYPISLVNRTTNILVSEKMGQQLRSRLNLSHVRNQDAHMI